MITSLTTSLIRITLFWYILGVLVLFIGDPAWAEQAYTRLALYPWVPTVKFHGLGTAASVQWHLLAYWTMPILVMWAISISVSYGVTWLYQSSHLSARKDRLAPRGKFWGVTVPGYSIGALPEATTPALTGAPVTLPGGTYKKGAATVTLGNVLNEAVNLLTPAERLLCEELLQLLYAAPGHFAGHGHGVGLLEHTLNVVTEAAVKCNPEFRLPLIAALAHDIGKLVTFQPDGKGGWVRRGLHSRESVRILATLSGFEALPELHRDALLLAVKYDHAPNKMPQLRGSREASMLAMRIITALSHADKAATAGEKDRNLVKLKPEDLLWQDFIDFLREAPVVQRGKKGAANQVNNPPDSPYVYIYEAPWRDAAIPRMPAEVAAALDLTRRDPGKLAKYTRILAERLRKEGLLVDEHEGKSVSEANPLWDIQSGTGEKAVVLRGILVLRADALWKAVNYRISTKSPFPVQILAPNGDADGAVNEAPKANREVPKTPDVTDVVKVDDVNSSDTMAALGLTAQADVTPAASEASAEASAEDASHPTHSAPAAPKPKTRGRFKGAAPSQAQDDVLGLGLGPAKKPEKPKREQDAAPTAPSIENAPPVPEAAIAAETVPDAEPLATEEPAAFDMSSMLESALGALKTETPTLEATEDFPEMMWEEPVDAPMEPAPQPVVEVAPAPAETAAAPAPKPAPAKEPNPQPAAVKEPAPASNEVTSPELSRAEKREGLAIADEAACAAYPGLDLGDKYYTEHSRAVQAGLKKPGSRYKGDDKSKQIELTASGPRRGRRKPS
ncbi:uncharacterized protein NMK_2021 [Novimethylophilus kurashikiensis]|uniref:HD domain-containing protein n=1 Tax=Novimethylophilus kurashikiensis TaxID=1825523 RepID=A0A2R5F851_9PROT|nr:HD domain-containing protein [Novimethylophilus kurashikiensis]GBG14422.1 uncharacterized protein NMK_2021 [Novimethylophilus kurashikiensis]